jgi:lipopolysaccharide transport system permease protein
VKLTTVVLRCAGIQYSGKLIAILNLLKSIGAGLHSNQETLIDASKSGPMLNIIELWSYRELLFFLALKDIRIRYKQTVFGAAWAILQPLMMMVVFTVLFSLLLGRDRMPTPEGVPYMVSTYCALLPWQLFATSLITSSQSLVNNSNLITKVYFPRLLIPLATIISSLVDFFLAFILLAVMMLWKGIAPAWNVLFLPLWILLAVVAALSVGLWIAALTVEYRDFRHVIPFVIQVWFFITPVVYTSESILRKGPPGTDILLGLNPMAGVVEGFRWCLLGAHPPGALLLFSALGTLLLLLGALWNFRRMERSFADVI